MSLDPNRAKGCLLGLAVGDALGTSLEFKPPGSFEPLTDMRGGGPFNLQPGAWTDDTSMALCLVDSLLETGWDPTDQMQRYCRWWHQGYRSSTDRCFDIGNTVSSALHRFELSGDPMSGSTDPYSAGNGSLMRLAPIPLFFHADNQLAEQRAAEMSCTTHAAPSCVDACRYTTRLIIQLLHGLEKEAALKAAAQTPELCPEIQEVAEGSFRVRQPPEIKGSGYVVKSLEAALWAFHHSSDFKTGALLAVNLGDDADTTGAIYGQIAGAAYGIDAIPATWMERIVHYQEIVEMGIQLSL